jgi:hypothetical protein
VWTVSHGFIPLKLLADGLQDFHLNKWDIVNPHVTRLDENSAVLIYSWTATGTFGNEPLPATSLASTVWTRREGTWRAAHHQETELVKN